MLNVPISFIRQGIIVPIVNIVTLRQTVISAKSRKFRQVLASVREVGIIEPLIVCLQNDQPDTYLLLDGHVRLEVLKEMGETHVHCLVSTDDEAYTYNKRVNPMATIQEHTMILKATQNGVSEERIAEVLKVDIARIRMKRDLLSGICREAAELLKTKHIAIRVFSFLRKVKSVRQIEIVELLIVAGNYSVPYVQALVAATQPEMLVDPDKNKVTKGLAPEQIARMEKEMEVLQRDLRVVEEMHGTQVLNFVLARGYLAKLFGNSRISRYLNQHHAGLCHELQVVAGGSSLEG